LLSSVLTLSKGLSRASTPTRAPSVTFLAAVTDKDVSGVALRSPNHRWLVSAETDQAAQILAREIATREALAAAPLRSILIPTDLTDVFEQAGELRSKSRQNLMSLSKIRPIEGAPGLLRFALNKDLKLLTHWSKAFANEGGLDESPSEAEVIVRKYLDTKQLFVWENGGRPVAMAAIGGFTPHAARISMVYTEPRSRGHGYASTLVHRVSHKLLQDGKNCVLFADATNLKTKYIYEKLGYRTIAQFAELKSQDSFEGLMNGPVTGSVNSPATGSNVTITG
jgi:GNAT superfamily N-acetyltransferase